MLMNNRVRAALQRHYEAPLLERLGGRTPGAHVREVGRCVGTGRFFFEEVTRHALDRWSYRTVLDHPDHDRFSATEFVAAVADAGFETTSDRWVERFFGDFVIGVALRHRR